MVSWNDQWTTVFTLQAARNVRIYNVMKLGNLYSGVQEGFRSSACKLEEHRQQGLVKDGNHLGGAEVSAQNRSDGVKVWPNASTWIGLD